ncbi:C-type lectin domain-containing protein [Caenorhabditis elegans]|uniref:C-type lectin domain-containing protein n=3 Tax=Caenorhabditis elegans TaxID=6239 RepID=Q9XVT9_CAEEL|nr:C-type lectin domain-containing protein [Caenorhabditis elegans]CAB02321.1 C-type lectin domain-containing protein [Caenorhabditis elegans]|eukprot:NP_001255932.1 C-type LECtin [Caenorhabditis elegans]
MSTVLGKLLILSVCLVGIFGNRIFGVKTCPKGWLQFEDNCYIRQPDFSSFRESVKNCEKRGAKLFHFDDSFEFEAVRNLFPDYYFTWMQAEVEEELEWLYEPYEEKMNGKNSAAKCIAFYSSPTKSYNYFYPCTSHFHSICEKSLQSFRQWMD